MTRQSSPRMSPTVDTAPPAALHRAPNRMPMHSHVMPAMYIDGNEVGRPGSRAGRAPMLVDIDVAARSGTEKPVSAFGDGVCAETIADCRGDCARDVVAYDGDRLRGRRSAVASLRVGRCACVGVAPPRLAWVPSEYFLLDCAPMASECTCAPSVHAV